MIHGPSNVKLREWNSALRHRIIRYVAAAVLEESAASIMRVEVNRNIEAAVSSGWLVNTHETTHYHEFKNYNHKP